MTRPFVVGDTIFINDVAGVVDELKLTATILSTEDGEKITIPNNKIVGEVLTNSFEYKVVEGTVGISYNDYPEKPLAAFTMFWGLSTQFLRNRRPKSESRPLPIHPST